LNLQRVYRQFDYLAGHRVSLLAAFAVEGALMDTHWNAIPVHFKQQLTIDFKRMVCETDASPADPSCRAATARNCA